jgi:hypothetical protein
MRMLFKRTPLEAPCKWITVRQVRQVGAEKDRDVASWDRR